MRCSKLSHLPESREKQLWRKLQPQKQADVVACRAARKNSKPVAKTDSSLARLRQKLNTSRGLFCSFRKLATNAPPTKRFSNSQIAEHHLRRSEERRVGKECRSRWSPY